MLCMRFWRHNCSVLRRSEHCSGWTEFYAGPPNMSPEERERMFQERREKMQALCQKGFQSCMIACPSASPTSLMRAVLPLLAPSASFSVFSPSIEPLADCLEELKVDSLPRLFDPLSICSGFLNNIQFYAVIKTMGIVQYSRSCLQALIEKLRIP